MEVSLTSHLNRARATSFKSHISPATRASGASSRNSQQRFQPLLRHILKRVRNMPSTTFSAIRAVSSRAWFPKPAHAIPFQSRFLTTSNMNSKTAIITGASGGIGSAIAQRFSQAGYDCILIGRSIPKLDFCLSSLAPGNHLVQPTDIANEQSWNDLRKALKDEKRTCDVLVNAAGVTHASFLIRTESSVINHIIDTNLTGTILGCKTVLKSFMVPKRKGVIINIASLLAQKGGRGASVYAASKAGIVGLTRSLVTETAGTNIRINCILPGYITTNMTSEGKLFSSFQFISVHLNYVSLSRQAHDRYALAPNPDPFIRG